MKGIFGASSYTVRSKKEKSIRWAVLDCLPGPIFENDLGLEAAFTSTGCTKGSGIGK